MYFDPVTPVTIALQAARIGFEAQSVIAMRLAGMAGLWNTPPSEMTRMFAEKTEAVMEAFEASTRAALGGAAPDAVLSAGMTEIGRYTSGNMARLSSRGPSFW